MWRRFTASRRTGARLAASCLVALALASAARLEAKTPGTTYCFLGVCHRVLSIQETAQAVGTPVAVIASYYDVPWRDRFNPSLVTSSGELFRAEDDDNAASPIYPDGTRLLVWEPSGGAALVIRINNAGPYYSDRLLDLSWGSAARLGLLQRGVGSVELMVLSAPQAEETRYQFARSYAPVPGYIGRFESLAAAHQAWLAHPDAKAEAPAVVAIAPEGAATARAERVVVMPGARSRRMRGRRVVLLPVKQRRPLLLQVRAAERAKRRLVNIRR